MKGILESKNLWITACVHIHLLSEYLKWKKYLLKDELSLLKFEKQLYQEENDHDCRHLLQYHSSRDNSLCFIGSWKGLADFAKGGSHSPVSQRETWSPPPSSGHKLEYLVPVNFDSNICF